MTDKTEHPIRFFADDEAVRHVARGLLDCSLPRAEWTHEAHLAATTCLVREYPDFVPERDLPETIARYNEAVGGVNSDSEGYHETITQAYVRAVRVHCAEHPGGSLSACVNALLASHRGARDYPPRFWSEEVLFSVAARRGFAEPDLAPLETLPQI
jgi:hypothetical protein